MSVAFLLSLLAALFNRIHYLMMANVFVRVIAVVSAGIWKIVLASIVLIMTMFPNHSHLYRLDLKLVVP